MNEQGVDPRVARQVADWRDQLIDLTRRNRLLYFNHTRSASLELSQPDMTKIFGTLTKPTGYWSFFSPPIGPDGKPITTDRAPTPTELVTDKETPALLDRSLRALERGAKEAYTDRGIWTLYVGLGCLQWVDADGRRAESPLLLVPVDFGRQSLQEPFRLRFRDDEDLSLNQALAVKLAKDFNITLPQLEDADEVDLAALLASIRRAVRPQREWRVVDRAVLHLFSFQSESMYRDLLDNEAQIARHRLIRVITLGPKAPEAAELIFDPPAPASLDEYAPPEDLRHIRDADSSQRRCVLAAREGRSFVMDGPPGTGKSQTITNIIAELLAAGRTVLFVSEKAAALDVVYKRLRESQLHEFVLELHSHQATRKAVASELGRSLRARPAARSNFDRTEVQRLRQTREQLSRYAVALNEPRFPLGRSLFDVLGRLGQLHADSTPPPAVGYDLGTTPQRLADLLSEVEVLANAWGPVSRGEAFLWRDLDDRRTTPLVFDDRRRQLRAAAESLSEVDRRCDLVAEELGLPWIAARPHLDRAIDLLHLLDNRIEVPVEWLTDASLTEIEQAIDEFAPLTDRYRQQARQLDDVAGPNWPQLSEDIGVRVHDAVMVLQRLPLGMTPDVDDHAETYRDLAVRVEALGSRFDALNRRASPALAALGVTPEASNLTSVERVTQLSRTLEINPTPLPTWTDPSIFQSARDARQILGQLIEQIRERRGVIGATFRQSIVTLDLDALIPRFAERHVGLHKLGAAYRSDKAIIAPHVLIGKVTKNVISCLPDAASLKHLLESLNQEESRHASPLGHFYEREDTEFSRLDQALDCLQTVLDIGDGTVVPTSLAAVLDKDAGRSWREDLHEAESLFAEISHELAGPLQRIAGQASQLPITTASSHCRDLADKLNLLASLVEEIGATLRTRHPVEPSRQIASLRTRTARIEHTVVTAGESLTRLFGSRFGGLSTDWQSNRSALDWIHRVISVLGSRPPGLIADVLLTTGIQSTELGPYRDRLVATCVNVLEPFAPAMRSDLGIRLVSSYAEAARLLDELLMTVHDAEEWVRFDATVNRLKELGVGDVVEQCVAQISAPSDLAPAIERSALTSWADKRWSEIASDLTPHNTKDRSRLVERFHDLDRLHQTFSAAEIINSCAARRPSTLVGEAAVIAKESEKQRRHMPIRVLLDKAGRAAQLIKPCFMMSPLSVSQFLPAAMRFDVVIFDEASQVRPSSAVNCIYRAAQLIVAGDQRQLPPTSFWATGRGGNGDDYIEDEIEDFQSVLDLAKASSAIPSLPLNWHYRSAHESLIAYSNVAFYDSALTTFPSAVQEAEDLGIELFKVKGNYDGGKGGSRTNTVEASKAVERVRFHLEHHPDRSLGVVAFSAVQQQAIEDELERAARIYPVLDRTLRDDRLEGFFVKNLENVQGDERDIIIFCIGYGPDETGKLSMNFGPLSKEGGARRLNVAITRARRRIEIITSFFGSDLRVDGASKDGVRHLRGYLEFAARGTPAHQRAAAIPWSEALEDDLAHELEKWGYTVARSVGLGDFRVDIAVVDPRDDHSFLLGIMTDGARYAAAATARDRDRLREDVLHHLGWRVHRVWSTGWYQNRKNELALIREAINEAMGTGRREQQRDLSQALSGPHITVEQHDASALPSWAEPYREAHPQVPHNRRAPYELSSLPDLRAMVKEIVDVEGPIHVNRILRSVRVHWKIDSGGQRTRDAVEATVKGFVRNGTFVATGDGFVARAGASLGRVRVPDSDLESTKRKLDDISDPELEAALVGLVRGSGSIDRSELVAGVARLFGWGRTGPLIESKLESLIVRLRERGALTGPAGALQHQDAPDQAASERVPHPEALAYANRLVHPVRKQYADQAIAAWTIGTPVPIPIDENQSIVAERLRTWGVS